MLPSAAARARGSGRTRRRSHFPWCGLHTPTLCKHSRVQTPQFSDELACFAVMHACMLDALDAKVCAMASLLSAQLSSVCTCLPLPCMHMAPTLGLPRACQATSGMRAAHCQSRP
jgi:hypothetical protein